MSHINVKWSFENIDIFVIRNGIFNSINDKQKHFKGRLLDIGCGKMPYRKYLLNNSAIEKYDGMDIEAALIYDNKVQPDYTWDGITMPFEDNSYETVIATEVLEHCPYPNITLSETYRVLKPSGVFFFTVPFLWNLHEIPHDEYRYTPFALQRLLKEAGFKDIEIKATGGWNASLVQMIGLWLKRGPYRNNRASLIYKILNPLLKYLLKKDKPPKDFFKPVMMPGLYGVAFK